MNKFYFNNNKYLEAEAERLGGEPVAFSSQGEFSIGFIRRPIRGTGKADCISVYGGPSLDIDRLGIRQATVALECALTSLDVNSKPVSLFMRGAVGESLVPLSRLRSRVEKIGDSVIVPIAGDADMVFSGFRKKQRNELRNGEQFFVSQCDDIEGFHRVYTESMERARARPEYFFSVDYLRRLMEIPGAYLYSIRDGRDLLCSAMFVEQYPFLVYHLSGTATSALRRSPMRSLLAYVAMEHAGGRWQGLSLGGGVGGANDSLMRFKQGFSKAMLPVYGLKVIVDPESYAELSSIDLWDEPDLSGFFPAYREPASNRRVPNS